MTRKRGTPHFTPVDNTAPPERRTAPHGRLTLVADDGVAVVPDYDDWPPDYERLGFDPDEVVPPPERPQIVREIVGDDDAAYFEAMRGWRDDGWRRGNAPF
ncbi:hypothetical protein [Leucobacter chromiireducens]|uniref:hypothetical protein n=1 Tax=Leucobacter chromiireducens TaxID=283877 RepID=UPI003F808DF5